LRRVAACLAGAALCVALAPPVTNASASGAVPSAATTAMLAGLNSFAGFTTGLGTLGALGQPMPLLDVTPGGSAGLAFAPDPSAPEAGLFDGAVYKQMNDELTALEGSLSGTVNVSDLASGSPYDVHLTGGGPDRVVHLTVAYALNGSAQQLIFNLTVDRDLAAAGLEAKGTTGSGQTIDLTAKKAVAAHIHFTAHFAAAVDPTFATPYFYLVDDGTGPTMSVAATATTTSPVTSIKGAIGILGVNLTAASFHSSENLNVNFDDPNNDGQLAFTESDGTTTGELGQDGAAPGLTHVTFGSPAGSVDNGSGGAATFSVQTDNTGGLGLPNVTTTISVLWPDVSAGTPTVTADSGYAAAGDFLNMQLKDLSDGLSHLANTIVAAQRAQWQVSSVNTGNLELPYMKGTLADAVDASLVLQEFLTQYTANPSPKSKDQTTDPHKIGTPVFTSLQDLIADLKTQSPALDDGSITVGTLTFTGDRFAIPLTITSPTSAAVSLDVIPLLATGKSTASYTSSSVTDTNYATSGFPTSLAGQTVTVLDKNTNKTETGVVDSVIGDILKLKEQTTIGSGVYWLVNGTTAGPTPGDGSEYKIKGGDAGTGAAEFGDLFKSAGITGANQQSLTPDAPISTATVKRSSTAKATWVLNLQNPIKGADCNTASAATAFPQYSELPKACPFTHLNLDGSSTQINELPSPADRQMLRTGGPGPLVSATFAIDSPVDLNAMVGFLQVHLKGHLNLDPIDTTKPMWTIAMQDKGDLTLDQVVRLLVNGATNNPGDFVKERVNAQVSAASIKVDVPDSSTSLNPSYFGSAPPAITIAATDIRTLPAVADTSALTNPALIDFYFDPDHPTALLGPMVKSLQVLDGSLDAIEKRSGLFSTNVPGLGRSLGAMLSAQDSGGGGGVSYANDSGNNTSFLEDANRPYTNADQALVGREVSVGSQVMTIAGVIGTNGNASTRFIFTKMFQNVPANGTSYALNSALAAGLESLLANPPNSLQEALGTLSNTLGAGSTFIVAGVDSSSSTHAVKLALDWKRSAHTGANIVLSFTPQCSSCSPTQTTLTGSTTSATPVFIPVVVSEESAVGIEVPLANGIGPADAAALTVTGNSTVGGTLTAHLDSTAAPDATIGPLTVKLGNGTDHFQVEASYGLALGSSGGTGTKKLDALLNGTVTASAPGIGCSADPTNVTNLGLCAVIPIYTGSTSLGPVYLRLPATDPNMFSTAGNVNVDPGPVALGDAIAAATIDLSQFLDGIDHYLDMAEQTLAELSFGGKLPLVGDDLQEGSAFISSLKTQLHNQVNSLFVGAPIANKGDIDTAATNLQTALKSSFKTATVTDDVTCDPSPCTPATLIVNVKSVELTVKIGDEPAVNAPPLNVGIPGIQLHSNDNTPAFSAGLKWNIDVILGVSRDDGFYVKPDGSNAVVHAEASISGPTTDFSGQLAFLTMDFKPHTGGTNPCGTANACLVADIKLSGQLNASDLANPSDVADKFSFTLTGDVYIDWDFFVTIAAGGSDELLPGIKGEFKLTWHDPLAGGSDLDSSSLYIAFLGVKLDAGSFLSGVFGQIITEIKKVTDPLRPVIDQVEAPIPVLSDLSHLVGGGDVTIESIAEAFNSLAGGPDLTLVHRLVAILDFIDKLPTCTPSKHGGDCSIPLGDFVLVSSKALSTPNTPTYAANPDDVGTATGTPDASTFTGDLNKLNDNGSSFFDDPNQSSETDCAPDDSKLNGAAGHSGSAGLRFPFIDNPASLFGILLGADTTLACFDSGKLELGFSYSQEFGPVYAPPPVMVKISGSASVSLRIVGGLDTYGMRVAVQDKKPVEFLSSIFFTTRDETGAPLAVVAFTGKLGAGAAINLVIIDVSVVGGLVLTVSFTWRDPDNDGKFRFDEFLKTVEFNALCLFNVSGEFSFFLDLTITIGLGPFSTSFTLHLANIKLLDFSIPINCEPAPPTLGAVDSNVLLLYAGKLGGNGSSTPRGDEAWDAKNASDETWKVTQYYDNSNPAKPTGVVAIDALGFHEEKTGVTAVLLDGRGYNGNLTVVMQGAIDPKFAPSNADAKNGTGKQQTPVSLPFTLEAVIFGGNGKDNIKSGQGANYIDAGPNDDAINTSDIKGGSGGRISGGTGADGINVGNAGDSVFGDRSLQVNGESTWKGYPVMDWTKLPPGDPTSSGTTFSADRGDTINLGLGADTIWGDGGDDHIIVAPDSSDGSIKSPGVTIVGGDGSDTITGGNGPDTIYTGRTKTGNDAHGDSAGGGDNCATYTGAVCDSGHPINTVNTGGGVDPKTNLAVGGGSDTVYGGAGEDIVSGHSLPTASDTTQHDTIYGGGANDVLSGGYGADYIFGGPGNDYVIAEPSEISDPGSDEIVNSINYGPFRTVTHTALPSNASSAKKHLVGNGGNDHIFGGNGGADIWGDSDAEAACPTTNPPPAGATPPDETGQTVPPDGNDHIIGGSGTDVVEAGGGDDLADSGTGNDFVCGGAGNDTLTSHSQVGQKDIAYGGSGKDVMSGGDGGDYLFGNSGNDTIYGKNGDDTLEGNADVDTIFGGVGADLVIGGTTLAGELDAGDTLYGDTSSDVIIGDNGAQLTPADATDMSAAGVISGDHPASFDLADGNGASSHGGRDTIYAGDSDDVAFGGLDKDVIFGGKQDDHLEGGPDTDIVLGESGQDDIIGGTYQLVSGSATAQTGVGFQDAGDIIFGGDDADVVLADNGSIVRSGKPGYDATNTRFTDGRIATSRTVLPSDLGDTPAASTSGADFVDGGGANDAILGQGGDDRLIGRDGNDYIEGGPAKDWLEGDAGEDDLVGGSSFIETDSGNMAVGQPDDTDLILGGADDDAMAGDNARIISIAGTSGTISSRVFTRLGSTGALIRPRIITLLDLNGVSFLTPPSPIRYGGDQIDGGAGNDLAFGQDGADYITGGTGDDYVQGNGGADVIKGDFPLDQAAPDGLVIGSFINPADWAGNPSGLSVLFYVPPAPSSVAGSDGTNCAVILTQCQDDLIGGSSIQAFRDANDQIEGDYGDDFELGDNGTLVRDVAGSAETTFTLRSPNTTKIRHHDDSMAGLTSTRFCTTAQTTCEPANAFGGDTMYGDTGNDNMWGQDGTDIMYGGLDNDDMYGELGADVMDGGPGQDVMLGDRGGAVDILENGSRTFTNMLSSAPQETYVGLAAGTYDRQVDLRHDVDGASFVGSATSAAMAHNGMTEGGDDLMMGGPGRDSMHGGMGNDTMDGDAGGDIVFGDDGADVLYGGQGCDPTASAANQDLADLCPLLNGQPDLSNRGTADRWLDYVFGGKGGTDPVSLAGAVGSDIIDFAPRGTYAGCTPNPWPVIDADGTIHDPCLWWLITMRNDPNFLVHQDHQGTDWIYGGWDRDVMQGDVAANGPNPGDRLIDWTGAYNLYTHCNAAYGGYNDIRQISSPLLPFLRTWAWGSGAGQTISDVNTSGTSAFDEVAIVYSSDINTHGAGSAYPTTPGHFDNPSCAA